MSRTKNQLRTRSGLSEERKLDDGLFMDSGAKQGWRVQG